MNFKIPFPSFCFHHFLISIGSCARQEKIRMLLSLATQKHWTIHHMDVKSAFLNGYLDEEVYVYQSQGFLMQGKEHHVYKLKEALYVSSKL